MELRALGRGHELTSHRCHGMAQEAGVGAGAADNREIGTMTESEEEGDPYPTDDRRAKVEKWRNIIGFWILGLCNNYPYVVMLSAAFDILGDLQDHGKDSSSDDDDDDNNGRDCHKQSTAVILLADILPTFIIKLTFPYFMNFIAYWIRVLAVVFFLAVCFIVVGLNGLAFTNEALVIFGVVCASIGSGIGELTFLAFTARYDKSTIAGWSSGTGAAGVAGALVYLVLRFALSAQVTLLIQTFTPILMLVTYFFVLGKPGAILPTEVEGHRQGSGAGVPGVQSEKKGSLLESEEGSDLEEDEVTFMGPVSVDRWRSKFFKIKLFNRKELEFWWSHVKYVRHLVFRYMLPLFAVYMAEYMINQGLYELFIYPDTHLGSIDISQATQYRLLQVMYQVGVLVSRTSIAVVHIKFFWVLAIVQVMNFYFLFCEAIYLFIPSFWITFFIIFFEGLMGGAVYANAFYSISLRVPKVHREFSMGVASVADSSGIVAAGVASIFIHHYICGLPT